MRVTENELDGADGFQDWKIDKVDGDNELVECIGDLDNEIETTRIQKKAILEGIKRFLRDYRPC